MKRLILSMSVAAGLIGGPCLLAGPEPLDTKDSKVIPQPVVEPPPCRWTGFYFGGHVGYGWGEVSLNELDEMSDPVFHQDPEGFFGGGQAGFNLQLGSWFVMGVEGEFAASGIDDKTKVFLPNDDETKVIMSDSDWIATAAARVGVSFWKNRLLAYVKGGAAFSHFDYGIREEGSDPPGKFDTDNDWVVPLVGVGLEYAITCHWSVKLEYKHFFFESQDLVGIEQDEFSTETKTFRVETDLDSAQFGLNYKF